jgi:hypothetical protein
MLKYLSKSFLDGCRKKLFSLYKKITLAFETNDEHQARNY